MAEPVPPYLADANPVRPEDGPQDVPQDPGSVVDLARLLVSPLPVGVDAILTAARSQLGKTASSGGWTPWGQWYANRHHDPAFATGNFCDMFASWCGSQAGVGAAVGEYAFCPWHAAWFAAHGHWGHTPRPGAIVFYNWKGLLGSPDDAEHVGIVESQRSDGRIVVIEGNTTENGAGGPAGVWRRVRNPSGVVIGYGYPPYPSTPPVPVTVDNDAWFMGV